MAWLDKKAEFVVLISVVMCTGCGATQVKQKTQTIVFDRGDVVTAETNRAEEKGRQVGPWTLPPLPVKLLETSEAFRQGFKEALSAIERPGPEVPIDAGPEAFDAWLKSGFESWLSDSVDIVKKCRELLEKVAQGPVNEAIVSAALVGLIDEHYDRLLDQIPLPPKLRGDQELVDIYRQELDRVRLPWLKKSISALVHCVSESSRQHTPLYEQWKRFCAEHAYALDASHHGIKRRIEQAEKQAREEAERIRRFGLRPEGPPICWQPAIGRGPLEQTSEQPDSEANHKAQTAAIKDDPSPRDAYYGQVDARTDVRVSILSSDNAQISPAPLHDRRIRKLLATCFAKNFTQVQRVTAAIKMVLSVSKRGRVSEISLKTVDATAAAYLEPKFKKCLNKRLKQIRFSRIATDQGTVINAIVCMRRSAHDRVIQSQTEPATDTDAETDATTEAESNTESQ